MTCRNYSKFAFQCPKMKLCWNTAALTHLCAISACFHTTVAKTTWPTKPKYLFFGPLQKSLPTLARELRREFREESEPGIRVGGDGVPEIKNRDVSVPRARSGVWRGPKNTSWGCCPPDCPHRNSSLHSRPRRPAKEQRQ